MLGKVNSNNDLAGSNDVKASSHVSKLPFNTHQCVKNYLST